MIFYNSHPDIPSLSVCMMDPLPDAIEADPLMSSWVYVLMGRAGYRLGYVVLRGNNVTMMGTTVLHRSDREEFLSALDQMMTRHDPHLSSPYHLPINHEMDLSRVGGKWDIYGTSLVLEMEEDMFSLMVSR